MMQQPGNFCLPEPLRHMMRPYVANRDGKRISYKPIPQDSKPNFFQNSFNMELQRISLAALKPFYVDLYAFHGESATTHM